MSTNSTGILLIAAGHPNYARMAATLAASIKATDHNTNILLYYTKESLSGISAEQHKLFDSLLELPEHTYRREGSKKNEYIMAKTHIYDLSVYDTTLFFDADTIWLPKRTPKQLFDELADIDFTIANRDYLVMMDAVKKPKYSIWCDVEEVQMVYGFTEEKYYSLHSEFVYFKKNDSNKKYFDTAKKVFLNPRVQPTEFANSIPDELAYSIACMLCKKYPHKTPYTPSYWGIAEAGNKLKDGELYDKYYLMSIGGIKNDSTTIDRYNRLSRIAAQKTNQGNLYQYRHKKDYLIERKRV